MMRLLVEDNNSKKQPGCDREQAVGADIDSASLHRPFWNAFTNSWLHLVQQLQQRDSWHLCKCPQQYGSLLDVQGGTSAQYLAHRTLQLGQRLSTNRSKAHTAGNHRSHPRAACNPYRLHVPALCLGLLIRYAVLHAQPCH